MTTQADRALIALLRENARASTAELARRLGVSRTTVQSRIERLERQGVIAGYGVKLSPEHERNLVKAHILVTVPPKQSAAVAAALRGMAEVRTLHSVSGNFDMIIVVEAPSVADLDLVIDRIGALDGVERTLSSIILSTRIDR
ncbi:Lrp/AsnC family transcriptional regulator [Kumtagia ephedrae]|jgi:DNA-binding Lrp family transcriptional regulator|uniref:AsnC family transcriptional regulator n=1 Tax=Kumtagia ephedrae TaxID=2116701 RepID=A0A2P7RJX3_9HYPH|nr:Lrp/AsnC family transcriptional regulator [Mesorhizobium ephedrae]PSJ50511.1 AsnC family transcriptional regulator [Mesorhizobium ephedrae]